jgi:hypothetical protein
VLKEDETTGLVKARTLSALALLLVTLLIANLSAMVPVFGGADDTVFRGVVDITTKPGGGYYWFGVEIKEILLQPFENNLKIGDETYLSVHEQGQVIGNPQLQSYVEVYAEYAGCCTGQRYMVDVWLDYHYIKVLQNTVTSSTTTPEFEGWATMIVAVIGLVSVTALMQRRKR